MLSLVGKSGESRFLFSILRFILFHRETGVADRMVNPFLPWIVENRPKLSRPVQTWRISFWKDTLRKPNCEKMTYVRQNGVTLQM